MSHALRVRGLKRYRDYCYHINLSSHALRVRGLKQRRCLSPLPAFRVARSTRAWIETYLPGRILSVNGSHALRVRGLKRPLRRRRCRPICRRTLYACVD